MYLCPVCGYDQLEDPPKSFTICPSCGTEYGFDDAFLTYPELRAAWVGNGAKWWSPVDPLSTNWNPSTQLLNVMAASQVGSFALSQHLEGKVAFHISPPPTGGSSSSRIVPFCRMGRRPTRKAARGFRRSISNNEFNSQSGMFTPTVGGTRRPAA
jgi:hypothetical protein